jgi:hypothetical protein
VGLSYTYEPFARAAQDVMPSPKLASRCAETALGGVADCKLAHGYHQRDVGPNSPTQTGQGKPVAERATWLDRTR